MTNDDSLFQSVDPFVGISDGVSLDMPLGIGMGLVEMGSASVGRSLGMAEREGFNERDGVWLGRYVMVGSMDMDGILLGESLLW
jgi:hypothetical protein